MDNLEAMENISYATARNWEKLKTDGSGRLVSRANKRKSKKRILPLEYFCNLDNVYFVQALIDLAEESEIPADSVIFSLAVSILRQHGILRLRHVQDVLKEYAHIDLCEEIAALTPPTDEADVMGLVYQSFLHEGRKNTIGSYYTPRKVVKNMVESFDFSNNETLLDPCCGSGAFLLGVDASDPSRLFGVDNDEIAVLIAKVNLLIKYDKKVFYPQIYCLDFLRGNSLLAESDIFTKQFDYIVTNPPWGAVGNSYGDVFFNIVSNETFSCFFVAAYRLLKTNGIIRFLFPEAILNVKTHKDIRSFILAKTQIKAVTAYDDMFAGVTTKYVDIECINARQGTKFIYQNNLGTQKVDIHTIFETENLVFNFIDRVDLDIIKQVKSMGAYTLENSVWALGIVTGDNKKKLSASMQAGMEKIYTGKEIDAYFLKPAKNYILYERENLQQVAKDSIYRAEEKLVYKFISNKLVFAYDNTGSLFLNSANILIPSIPNMTIKTVMAFLNSRLFRFLYGKLFGELKILKGNLTELPFPKISDESNALISSKVDELLGGDSSKEAEIEDIILNLYGFTAEQISYIRGAVNGKTS